MQPESIQLEIQKTFNIICLLIFGIFRELKQLCQNQVKRLLGTDGLEILKFMNKEPTSAELLGTKFAQLVGNLTNESQRIEADQVAIFCQKIYDIERFDLGELTSWLSPDQV